jgi:hypothetical protein
VVQDLTKDHLEKLAICVMERVGQNAKSVILAAVNIKENVKDVKVLASTHNLSSFILNNIQLYI